MHCTDFYAEIIYTQHASLAGCFTQLNKNQFFLLYSPIWELENVVSVLQSLSVCLQNSLRKYYVKCWDQSTKSLPHLMFLGSGCVAPLPLTPCLGCMWAVKSPTQELQSIWPETAVRIQNTKFIPAKPDDSFFWRLQVPCVKHFGEHKCSKIDAFEEAYSLIHFSSVNVLGG